MHEDYVCSDTMIKYKEMQKIVYQLIWKAYKGDILFIGLIEAKIKNDVI